MNRTAQIAQEMRVMNPERRQYDQCAKRIMSFKDILARTLKETVDECAGLSYRKIKRSLIGDVTVSPDSGERLDGDNTEISIPGEGTIRLDVSFRIAVNKKVIRVSIELLHVKVRRYVRPRSVFYAARDLSRQYGNSVTENDYSRLEKTYHILIIMNPPKGEEDRILSLGLRYFVKEGNVDVKHEVQRHFEEYDKIQLVEVCLGSNRKKGSVLLRLLKTLFRSEYLTGEELVDILDTEFGIPKEIVEKEVMEMCNLSEGLIERAEKRGERRGKRKADKKADKKFKVLEEENRQANEKARLAEEKTLQAKEETKEKLRKAVMVLFRKGLSVQEIYGMYPDDFTISELNELNRKALLS